MVEMLVEVALPSRANVLHFSSNEWRDEAQSSDAPTDDSDNICFMVVQAEFDASTLLHLHDAYRFCGTRPLELGLSLLRKNDGAQVAF